MKLTKKILSILLSCLMLLSMLSISVFAAAGTQSDPINANDKWFGYGVDCFLMNTDLVAGDTDGVWYKLTADAAGILHLENGYYSSEEPVEYQINVWVNDTEYHAYENGMYNRPIATYPVAVGDVILIQVLAQDTSLGGKIALNAKFIDGSNDITQMIKVKSAPAKLYVAAGATVFFQDDSLQAAYAAKYVNLTGDSVEDVTLYTAAANASGVVTIQSAYTDLDGDGIIETKLGGSEGSAGAPAVKPAWVIENNSNEDRCFVLSVVDAAHECADSDADNLCDSCAGEMAVGCPHEYAYDCDTICALCGEVTRPEAACQNSTTYPCQDGQCIYCGTAIPATTACEGYYPCSYACQYCGGVNPNKAPCTSDSYPCVDGACSLCGGFVAATISCVGEYPCSYACKYCSGVNPNKAPCTSNNPTCMNGACVDCGGFVAATTHHEYFYPCDPVCMNCYELTNPDATHTTVHVDAVAATCSAMGNIEYWYCSDCGACWADAALTMQTNRFSVVTPTVEHEYFNDCDTICMNCGEETRTVEHNVIYVEAKAPTCTELGNIEFWYCDVCGAAWTDEAQTQVTNLMAVKLGATCATNAEAHEAVEAGCHMNGMEAYWYCANCDVFYADAACTVVTNYKNLVIPAIGGEVVHVAAKEASCSAEGNVEHWYCETCEQVWTDAALTQLTNHKNVIIGKADHEYFYPCDPVCMNCYELTNPEAAHSMTYVPAKQATCQATGNIAFYTCEHCGGCWDNANATGMPLNRMMIITVGDHTYDNNCDSDCNLCGTVRDDAPHYVVGDYACNKICCVCWADMTTADHVYAFALDNSCDVCSEERDMDYPFAWNGFAISEDVNGLAARFDIQAEGLAVNGTTAIYDNATFAGMKLVSMGALVCNNYEKTQKKPTMEDVDGMHVLNVPAKYLCDFNAETGEASFAIRIINIPDAHKDTQIMYNPYVIVEDEAGAQHVLYISQWTASNSYNEVAAEW